MCIMEVRPGQRSSTIAQAMAHNTSTVERDLDMFKPLLRARQEWGLLEQIEKAHEALKTAYSEFLSVFTAEVTQEVENGHDHDHGEHNHGSEREALSADAQGMVVRIAERDAREARRFETR